MLCSPSRDRLPASPRGRKRMFMYCEYTPSPAPPTGYVAYRLYDDGRLFAVFRHGAVEIADGDVLLAKLHRANSGSLLRERWANHCHEPLRPRRLSAVQVFLKPPPQRSRSIIAGVDRDVTASVLWPAHPDHTFLDVKAGDVLVGRARRKETVERVEIFRAFPTSACGLTITCGRDWLEGRG